MTTYKKAVNVQGQCFECTYRKSKKAKRLRLTVYCDGQVIATMPKYLNYKDAEEFVFDKAGWILGKIEEFKKRGNSILFVRNNREYLRLKKQVQELVLKKIACFNQFYNLPISRVFIRNQKTRWGSCSSNRNLSFNYKIYYLPEKYQDYVVAHEICHLKEMNHSQNFWQLLAQTIPDCRQLSKEIRKM